MSGLPQEDQPMTRVVPAIAFLRLHHTGYGPSHDVDISIHARAEIDIGRIDIETAWNVVDTTISAHHVRLRCVVYDDDSEAHPVPEMVYFRVLSNNPVHLFLNQLQDQPESKGQTISNNSGDILLSSGDKLVLSPTISATLISRKQAVTRRTPFTVIQKHEMAVFSHLYCVSNRVLGVGGHATVYMATDRRRSRQLACKVLPTQKRQKVSSVGEQKIVNQRQADALYKQEHRKYLAREFNILQGLDHPNIIKLEKVFDATNNIYIFQELITGGDLLSYIDLKGALSEPQALVLIRQVLEAVRYLHNNDIVHRDLKPENILITSWRDGARLVLTDFGQARHVHPDFPGNKNTGFGRMQSEIGTRGYTAPEVLRLRNRGKNDDRGYGKAIDIWSVGCVAAILLTNDAMFADQGKSQLDDETDWDIWNAIDCNPVWHRIGRNAKSFVRSCLTIREEDRLTAEAALDHRWIKHPNYEVEVDDAYRRAVSDWKPRQKVEDVIETIRGEFSVEMFHSIIPRIESAPKSIDSSYFGSLPPVPPDGAHSTRKHALHPSPKRARTPLPSIADEFDDTQTYTPERPPDTQNDSEAGDQTRSFAACHTGPCSIPAPPLRTSFSALPSDRSSIQTKSLVPLDGGKTRLEANDFSHLGQPSKKAFLGFPPSSFSASRLTRLHHQALSSNAMRR